MPVPCYQLVFNVLLAVTLVVVLAAWWMRRTSWVRSLGYALVLLWTAWLVFGWLYYGFDSGAEQMTPGVRRTLLLVWTLALLFKIGRRSPRLRRTYKQWRERAEGWAQRESIRSMYVLGAAFILGWLALRDHLGDDASLALFSLGGAWVLLAAAMRVASSGPGATHKEAHDRRGRVAALTIFFLGVPLLVALWHLLTGS
jgi:hypothetical protein